MLYINYSCLYLEFFFYKSFNILQQLHCTMKKRQRVVDVGSETLDTLFNNTQGMLQSSIFLTSWFEIFRTLFM